MKRLHYEDVPRYIEEMMKKEGATALAERIEVKRQGLYKMASGATSPSLKSLQRLGVKLMVKS